MIDLTVDMLRKLLRYDYDAGKLFWRERPVGMFTDGKLAAQHSCNAWNTRYANTEAFTAVNAHGYLVGNIFYRQLRAHRVIWAIVTGFWPVEQIDHDDHDRSNNKFGNLSEATNQENGRNRSISKNNTSGVVGVSWYKYTSKWVAKIRIDGRAKHLGYFDDKADAIAARATANIEYDFHVNHGVAAP